MGLYFPGSFAPEVGLAKSRVARWSVSIFQVGPTRAGAEKKQVCGVRARGRRNEDHEMGLNVLGSLLQK